jgi:type IV pilus assembly protein PilE
MYGQWRVGPSSRSNAYQPATGFSLVELMVVIAVIGILAAVCMPAYSNYINRVRQTEAASQLLTASVEMEEFYNDNNRYANTIGCLPSFSTNSACLANCTNCNTIYRNPKGPCNGMGCYTFSLRSVTASTYSIIGTRLIYSGVPIDQVFIKSDSQVPDFSQSSLAALKWSVYYWLFNK